MRQTSFFCPQCQQMKLFQQEQMNHTPHLLAAIFLCGIWLPIWALMAATHNPPWRCSFCGFSDNVAYLSDPHKRKRDQIYYSEQASINAERQRLRLVEREERGENAFESFVREKRTPLIAGGVAVGVLGLIIIGSTFLSVANQPKPVAPATLTESPKQVADRANRRTIASSLQVEYGPTLKPLSMSVTGDKEDQLLVTSPSITEKWVTEFRRKKFEQLRFAGFQWVKLSNGKKEWSERP